METKRLKDFSDYVLFNANFHVILTVSIHTRIETSRHLALSLFRILQKSVYFIGKFLINCNHSTLVFMGL